jgi:uncharacterized membrane protein (UPF0182 family)
MYRTVMPRIQRIAPFFSYDRDPYLVITDDGRLVWMLDGYTTTDRYPYSEPVRGMGNYIRNSVKVTVDAYHGTVTFYVADPTDPLVRAYARGFPGLLQPLDRCRAICSATALSRGLLRHPGAKYATYHMLDPQCSTTARTCGRCRAGPWRGVSARWSRTTRSCAARRAKEEFILLTLFNRAAATT